MRGAGEGTKASPQGVADPPLRPVVTGRNDPVTAPMRTLFPAVVLAALAVLAGPARAQDGPALGLNLDAATFAYDDARTLVEVYLAIEARTLPFVAAPGGGFEAALPIDFALLPASDFAETPTATWADSTTLRFAVADTAGIDDGRQFIHVVRTTVAPGPYELRVTVPARAVGSEISARRDVRVPDYQAGAVAISEPVLATSIQQGGDAQSLLYRNGVTVRPNPTLVFGQTLSQLWYYAEVYRPGGAGAPGDSTYTLLAYVSDANRPQAVGGLERRLRRRVRGTDVVVNGFDLRRLPSGAYSLRLALLNANNEAVAEQARRFFVYNPNVQAPTVASADLDFESSPYVAMPMDEVDRGIEHATAVLPERERRRLRDLPDDDAKRRALWEFWQTRDPNPTTAANEYRDEFYRRLQYANDRYTRAGREGWRSDRGVVVLKYGLPSQVEPHLYDRETKAHEIWLYNNVPGEGQATFVFADLRNYGDFELIHSTVPGERRLADWRAELQK